MDENLRQPFVEDGVIAAVVRRQELGWQDLRYIGEDFAGRDDCPAPIASAHPWTTRQACGAFFTPAPEAPAPVIIAAPESHASEPPEETHAPLWRRSLAIASAAAILLSASLIGLWAAHSFAPQTSQDLPENNQHDAPMISQLSER
jgi:hypothetical protein